MVYDIIHRSQKNLIDLIARTQKFCFIVQINLKNLLKFNKILVHTLIKIMYTKSIIKIVMRWSTRRQLKIRITEQRNHII